MKYTLTTSEAADLLLKDSNAKWSYYAAHALAEYYEQLEEDMGEPIEFDAVAIRCDWDEYASVKEIADAYDNEGMTDGEYNEEDVIRYVERESEIIRLDNGGFLVRSF